MTLVPPQTAALIHPAILSGGTGSRLWPSSRSNYPKQLLNLAGEHSMLAETALRCADASRYLPPIVIGNEEHRFIIAEQLREVGVPPAAIMLEPEGRNTLAAAIVAALVVQAKQSDGLVLLMSADHVVLNLSAFHAAVAVGATAARQGHLVTFGIVPDAPVTSYGYIRKGSAVDTAEGCYRVAQFAEKPTVEIAQTYLDSGEFFWNGGIFLYAADAFLAEVERLAPESLAACRAAFASSAGDLDFRRLAAAEFLDQANISIDYAVMEKTDRAVVVPVDMGWSDAGSWSSLWALSDKDAAGNAVIGDAMLIDSNNCYVRAEDRLIVVLGMEGAVVVSTDDALLVTRLECDQDVKKVVDALKAAKRREAVSHKRVYRPWGFYQGVHEGERFQVKRITVYPGAKLSLQKHFHRAEHWVVVNGTAVVTRDEEKVLLAENQSIYLPLGCIHRLENPGKLPLNLIEVQSGPYLGEDDIVRIEDTYGRS
jgi:mannose-1-phosphate guanylyltransferase / mannose-6-phosphate isomerase